MLTAPRRPVRAVARHVSAEGCQFVVLDQRPGPGQHFTFALRTRRWIGGTVRWVVRDRIGFAFDAPLGADSVRELAGHFGSLTAVSLYSTLEPK